MENAIEKKNVAKLDLKFVLLKQVFNGLLYLNPDYKINNRLISIFGEQNTYIKLSG